MINIQNTIHMNTCFNYDVHATDQFWQWFGEQHELYASMPATNEVTQKQLADDFLIHLHYYCDKLFFEMGSLGSGMHELIVTAEGDPLYFTAAINLVNAAPFVPGWVFTALRPPWHQPFTARLGKLELHTGDLWFLPAPPEKDSIPELKIAIAGWAAIKNEQLLLPLLNKMIAKIVGERSFATEIHQIAVSDLPDQPEQSGLWPILELHDYLNWFRSTHPNGA